MWLVSVVLASGRMDALNQHSSRGELIKCTKSIVRSSRAVVVAEDKMAHGFNRATVMTVRTVRQAAVKKPLFGGRPSGSSPQEHG